MSNENLINETNEHSEVESAASEKLEVINDSNGTNHDEIVTTTEVCGGENVTHVDNVPVDAEISNVETNIPAEQDVVQLVETEDKKMSKFERDKRRNQLISKIVSGVLWAIGIFFLLLCSNNFYQQICNPAGYTGFFGIGEAVVASNSMEPKLYTNDLIFYKEVSQDKIAVDDIVVYEKINANGESMLIVHQIIELDNGYVITKGLNNAQEDEAFPISAIVGKYIFKISKIGVIANVLSTKWAPLVVISFLVMVFVLRIAIYYINKKRIVCAISSNQNTRKAIEYFFDI